MVTDMDKKDNVVDFGEFSHKMNQIGMTPNEKLIDDMAYNMDRVLEILKTQSELIGQLKELTKWNKDAVGDLIDHFYGMFPEVDIIDTVFDSEEERQQAYKKYLNLNEDFDAEP